MEIKMSKKQEILFLAAVFSSCIACVGTIVFNVVVNEVYNVYSAGIADTMVSIINIVLLVSSPFVPVMCARLGSKTTMIIGAALFSFAGLFTMTVEHTGYILAMRLLTGLGISICNTVGTVMINDAYSDLEKRGKVLGWYMIAMGGCGVLVGMVAGNLAASNWKNVFYSHILGVVVLVLTILFVPNVFNKTGGNAEGAGEGTEKKKGGMSLGGTFWMLAAIFALFNIFANFMQFYAAVYVEENAIGNPALLTGYYSSVVQGVGAVVGLIYGAVYGKMRHQTATGAFLLQTVSYLLCYIFPSMATLMINGIATGYMLTVCFSWFFAIAPATVPKESSNFAVGLLQAFYGMTFLIPYLLTAMRGLTGGTFTPTVLICGIVLAVLTAALFVICQSRIGKLKLEEQEEA